MEDIGISNNNQYTGDSLSEMVKPPVLEDMGKPAELFSEAFSTPADLSDFNKAFENSAISTDRKSIDKMFETKKQEKIKKGFAKAVLLCALGVISSLLMLMTSSYNYIFAAVVFIFSLLIFAKTTKLKALIMLLFFANVIYSAINLFNIIKKISELTSFFPIISCSVVAILSLFICLSVITNENLTVYYESENKSNF